MGVFGAAAEPQWFFLGTLVDEPSCRYFFRSGGNGRTIRALDTAGRAVGDFLPESRWFLGRNARFLPGSGTGRKRTGHAAAYGTRALRTTGCRADPSSSGRKGIRYLLRTQMADGGWSDEGWVTPLLLPDTFYTHPQAGLYFPMEALGRMLRSLQGT